MSTDLINIMKRKIHPLIKILIIVIQNVNYPLSFQIDTPPKIEAQAVKAILIGFAGAGAILFAVGLITRTKLEMWYIGLLFLIAALAAWFIQRSRK